MVLYCRTEIYCFQEILHLEIFKCRGFGYNPTCFWVWTIDTRVPTCQMSTGFRESKRLVYPFTKTRQPVDGRRVLAWNRRFCWFLCVCVYTLLTQCQFKPESLPSPCRTITQVLSTVCDDPYGTTTWSGTFCSGPPVSPCFWICWH